MHTYRTVAGRGFMLVGIAATAWLALSMLIGGWWQVRAALARPDIAEDIAAIQSNIIRAARQAGQPAQAQDAPPLMKVDLIVIGGAERQQLCEDAVIQDSLALTIPGLGGPTCFSFENAITAEQAAGVAQAYRYFSQGVVLEVR
jgi:hypothetical protein